MATLTQNRRFSLKYSSSQESRDVLARTISGFNIRTSASVDASLGPIINVAANGIVEMLQRFSVGTISNIRWVTEQEVTL